MAAREELAADQEVVVYVAYSGRVQPGWVVKVARKYVTITTNRMMGGYAREYAIDTQIARGQEREGAPSYFRTLEQDAARNRELAARQALRDLGILTAHHDGPRVKRIVSVDEMEAIVELITRMRQPVIVPRPWTAAEEAVFAEQAARLERARDDGMPD